MSPFKSLSKMTSSECEIDMQRWSEPASTGAEILQRAREIVPTLRAWAPAIEQNRRLPKEIVDLLRSAGVERCPNACQKFIQVSLAEEIMRVGYVD